MAKEDKIELPTIKTPLKGPRRTDLPDRPLPPPSAPAEPITVPSEPGTFPPQQTPVRYT